jgi:hypothetical protein
MKYLFLSPNRQGGIVVAETWTIAEEKVERRMGEATAIAEAAAERAPLKNTWGIFSYGDAPAAIGGGVGCFLWFKGREQLLEFVANQLTFLAPGRADIDPGRVLSAVKQIVRQVEDGHLTIADAIPQLNSALRHFSQIEWIGTFEGLIAGSGDFERGLRRWYREHRGTDLTDTVITAKELKAFRTAIAEYGM